MERLTELIGTYHESYSWFEAIATTNGGDHRAAP